MSGSNILRIVTAGILGIIVAIGGAVIDADTPGDFPAALWGLVTAAVKLLIDFLVAKFGPARPVPTDTSGTTSARSSTKGGSF